MDCQTAKPTKQHQPGVAHEDLQLILQRVPAKVWDALRGRRVFITGGTGFIGCWLLEALIWANQELELELQLIVLSRSPEAFRARVPHLAEHAIVRLVEGNTNALGHISEPFDMLIHAATDVAAANGKPHAVFNDILDGTRQTLELAVRCGASHYLLTSSGAVYGAQPATLTHLPELHEGAQDMSQPGAAYGAGKIASEWLLGWYAREYGLHASIARCFALLGPYLPLDGHFAAGNFIHNGLRGEPIVMRGDGSAVRSYLYAADMVVWLLTIMLNGESGQHYNVGSEHALNIGELAQLVAAQTDAPAPVRTSTASASLAAQRYVPATAKARKQLQLEQYTDLPSALSKTIDWARLHIIRSTIEKRP
ncbi:NAD-dependent epimerase/dehydratase family protein [Janthinobacterium sp. LB2P70]|uniref:NAD-dependent epimerase/dehydratase family protein n=1 Tax=Janthinobacterium sp. LB2P70 TaxID=3424197 RepID=UPI003F2846B7